MGGGVGLLAVFFGGSYHRRAPQMDCGREEREKWEEDGLLTRFSFCSDEEFRGS